MLKLLLGLILLHLLEAIEGKSTHIFGGEPTSIWKYPFLVNMRSSRFCGGALISPSCVLTAAHCLEGTDFDDITVHAQEQCLGDKSPQEHVRRAWYFTVSPRYNSSTFDSDVGLIRLKHSFDNSGNWTLVKVDYNDLPREANLIVMGWGQTGSGGHNKYQCLQAAEVKLKPQERCAKVYRVVTHNMFCALGENARDTCRGDSGGPVINADGRTVGIVSAGSGCGSGDPGLYTRLSNPYITYWLKTMVMSHCPPQIL